jgi:hypothetical protein
MAHTEKHISALINVSYDKPNPSSNQKSAFIQMQAGLFVLMAVSNEPSNEMDDKIGGAAMTRRLNLRNVLELVNDGLDDDPFAQQQLIRQMPEPIGHVFA